MANGGTLLLDEIGEIPLEMQAKLLRVLQEKEVQRVGSHHTIKTDVRIIASTNKNLEEEVAAGAFRLDLYYRLQVFPIAPAATPGKKGRHSPACLSFYQVLSIPGWINRCRVFMNES